MSKLITGLVTGVLLLLSLSLSAQPVVTITPQSNEVDVDQEFSVDIVVSNFSNIASMQFPIVWDPNVLEYVSVSNINSTALPGLNENFFGYNPDRPGKLAFLWFEPNFEGITLEDGTGIFTVTFRGKQDGTTNLEITDDPPGIEVSDPAGNLLGMTPQEATVIVGTGVGGGGGEPGPLVLSLGNQNVEVGQEVCLQLTADDFTDLVGLQFGLSYDASLLQFTEARSFSASVPGLDASAVNDPSPGSLRFQWTDPGFAGVTVPDGSVLLEFCFQAIGNGTAAVQFTNSPVVIEAVRKISADDQETIEVQTNDGTVNISGGGTGVEGFQLRIGDASVQPGEAFCLPVTVNDFQDIVGMQFSIQYDAALLQFDEARNFNASVDGLDANALTNPEAGVIRFAWIDGGFSGIDLADGAVLFELCFQAAQAGTASVAFSDIPLPIEVTQKVGADDQQIIDSMTEPGTVTITGDNGGGGPGFLGFGLYLEDQIVQSGDQVCMPIKVQDFEGLLGMQFSISYDPNALEFVEATGFAINGLTASSINSSNPGRISVQWDDPTVLGQDLEDGATLMELCFTVTASNGVSTVVAFTGDPTPVEFTRTADNPIGQEVIENYSFRDGRLQIGDGTGSFEGFGFILEDENPLSGEDFCLEMSVQDFTDIVGAQFTIEYDPSVLEFKEVANLNLEGLGSDAFGTPNPGTVTFRWFDPAVAGITLPDGTVIFELCFTATGPEGTATQVTFSNSPTAIEGVQKVGDTEEAIDDVGFNFGLVEIGTIEYEALQFASVDITNACAEGGTGSISVSMTGGRSPYMYSWSTGANGSSVSNLPAGDYSLTVTDSRGEVLGGTFEITTLQSITVDASVTQVTGVETNNNGAIDLSVTGGMPGYTISWNTGATGTQLNNLSTGEYCVTITDQNSCVVEDCYDVLFQAVPLSFSIEETNQPSCSGRSDGDLVITIAGGNSPYQVILEDGTQLTPQNGSVRVSDLPAGTVNFIVRDANNTTLEGEAQIPEPDPIQITEAFVVHDTDAPGCTGSIRLSITGGTPGYTVQWNAPNTGSQIINLCAGPFIPTIVDQAGCTQTFDPIEVTTFGASADVTNATCPANADGSVMLNVSGGAAPYTFEWTNSAGEVVGSNRNLEDVRPGTYQVTISEGSGNDIVREYTVGSTSNLSVSASLLTDFNGFGVSCSDASDAMLQAEAANGIGAYFYEWTRGDEMLGADAMLNEVPAGTYQVTAIDENGCEMTTSIEVAAPPEIAVSATITDISCNGEIDGEISLRASGGAGSTFFDYEWSSGANGPEIRRLRGGTYTVTVSDAFDCQTVKSYEVVEPDPIVVTIETEPANEGCNGSARAIVTGGTAPYFYKWNAADTDSELNDLCPGNYEVFVTDSRGCEPEVPKVSAVVSDRRFPCLESSPVITPNGDGDNDLFILNCIGDFPSNQLEVFNRFGQPVFEAENYDNTWDGTGIDGRILPEGPYYFVLLYTDGNNNEQQLKGSLTILHDE